MKKISVITVVKNGMPFIKNCIKSFKSQNYLNKEQIIVSEISTDGTVEYLKKIKDKNIKIIFVKKKLGIFKSLNYAVKFCNGYVVCYLHSDDEFINKNVLKKVMSNFINYDFVFGDVIFKYKNQIKRVWVHGKMNWLKRAFLIVPAHTSVFVKKAIVKKMRYKIKYAVSSDYEFMIKLFYHKYNSQYLNFFTTSMRLGGNSTKLENLFKKIKEDISILSKFTKFPIIFLIVKYLFKSNQFFLKK